LRCDIRVFLDNEGRFLGLGGKAIQNASGKWKMTNHWSFAVCHLPLELPFRFFGVRLAAPGLQSLYGYGSL
jgi:hypothetical protein